jgi:hypothetical protein
MIIIDYGEIDAQRRSVDVHVETQQKIIWTVGTV